MDTIAKTSCEGVAIALIGALLVACAANLLLIWFWC